MPRLRGTVPKPRFSRAALRDLQEILDYIAQDSPAQARRVRDALRARCRRLADFPDASPLRPELGEGIRVAVHGSYLILYSPRGGQGIVIERVSHGARDLAGTLE